MRETAGGTQPAGVAAYAKCEGVDLRTIDLDVGNQNSVDAGVARIIAAQGQIDGVMTRFARRCSTA